MARRYIPIDSKSDIDTGKIGVGNIENRYIDKNGQRYATRFNMRTRKIEIVPIALGNDEVIQAKMNRRSKKGEAEHGEEALQQNVTAGRLPRPDWVIKNDYQPSSDFNLQEFFSNLENESSKFAERIRGIISNIKKSDAFESAETESGKDFILDLTTFYDREIQENLGQAQNLVVEFTRFPKPPSNYFIHLDRKQKEHVEPMSEDEQMNYFQAYMIGMPYLKALEGCLHLLNQVKDQKNKVQTGQLTHERKNYYDNAFEAVEFVKESIDTEVGLVLAWLEQAQVF